MWSRRGEWFGGMGDGGTERAISCGCDKCSNSPYKSGKDIAQLAVRMHTARVGVDLNANLIFKFFIVLGNVGCFFFWSTGKGDAQLWLIFQVEKQMISEFKALKDIFGIFWDERGCENFG